MCSAVDTNGKISTFAGNGFAGGSAMEVSLSLSASVGLAIDSNDNIYVADRNNLRVRKLIPLESLLNLLVRMVREMKGDGGAAVEAKL